MKIIDRHLRRQGRANDHHPYLLIRTSKKNVNQVSGFFLLAKYTLPPNGKLGSSPRSSSSVKAVCSSSSNSRVLSEETVTLDRSPSFSASASTLAAMLFTFSKLRFLDSHESLCVHSARTEFNKSIFIDLLC